MILLQIVLSLVLLFLAVRSIQFNLKQQTPLSILSSVVFIFFLILVWLYRFEEAKKIYWLWLLSNAFSQKWFSFTALLLLVGTLIVLKFNQRFRFHQRELTDLVRHTSIKNAEKTGE